MSDSTSRKQSKDAARSVVVTLRNNTPFDLQLNRNTESLPHGKWDEYPPAFIRSGDKGAWKTESDEPMSGTEGRVSYNILDQSHNSVSVNWDDPFQGSDADGGSVSDTNRYKLDTPGPISGNNVEMDFTLRYLG
jgi:hypothetical protein